MEGNPGIRVAWMPILQICVLSLGTLGSFLLSYHQHIISIYLPFISETGGWPPGSCIFTLTIICGGFLGILVTFVRYLTVADSTKEDTILLLNRKALYIGLISWFGIMIVASFPMSTVLVVHLIGAGIHFCVGLVYVLMQTVLSHRLNPAGNKLPSIVRIRIGLCALLLVCLVFLLILFPIGQFNWKKKHGESFPAKKVPDDSGFDMVFASSFFEWAMYAIFLSYFATFVMEFRNYRLVTSVLSDVSAKGSEESVHNQDRINYVT